ncbi:MAG: hypothetical protein IMX00_08720 [Limnochordales bacterium]|nr:hypothetical protein [Limnochordales bacterium]
MPEWVDYLTGFCINCTDAWLSQVRRHLAGMLARELRRIGPSADSADPTAWIKGRADVAIRFWTQEYYRLVYPLRFGIDREAAGYGSSGQNRSSGHVGALLRWPAQDARSEEGGSGYETLRLRERFLDEMKLPPILPAAFWGPSSTTGDGTAPVRTSALAADQVGDIAATLYLALYDAAQASGRFDWLHALRLGVAVSPVWPEIEPDIPSLLKPPAVSGAAPLVELARAVAGFFQPGVPGAPGTGSPAEKAAPGTPDPDCSLVASVASLIEKLAAHPPTEEVVEVLRACRSTPLGRNHQASLNVELAVVVGGAQRIKQYVFESPGLNEIRGASTLLDEATREIRKKVEECLGPELVLRAAASTVVFLCPAAQAEKWRETIRRLLLSRCQVARVTTGVAKAKLADFLAEPGAFIGQAYRDQERERFSRQGPHWEPLPFEARCTLCRQRPASELYLFPGDEQAQPVCEPCRRKREKGRRERTGKSAAILNWVQVSARDLLAGRLGPGGKGWPETAVAQSGQSREGAAPGLDNQADGRTVPESEFKFFPNEISEIVGLDAEQGGRHREGEERRRLLAVLYADGNNFGRIVQRLKTLGQQRQWSHRVEAVTQAAVSLALADAIVQARKRSGRSFSHLPVEVLALGGDDVSLLLASSIALPVAAEFTRLTDAEFGRATAEAGEVTASFSTGVAVSHPSSPVRRLVELVEDEDGLLHWAKRAKVAGGSAGSADADGGRIAFWFTTSSEQLPESISDHLSRHFRKESLHGPVYLTLQPFTSRELEFLLDKARQLLSATSTAQSGEGVSDEEGTGNVTEKPGRAASVTGALTRLVTPFVKETPPIAALHYSYRAAREQSAGIPLRLCSLLEQPVADGSSWQSVFNARGWFPVLTIPGRPPFGGIVNDSGTTPASAAPMFTPLVDLWQIVKLLD